jgi:hypothetical protein
MEMGELSYHLRPEIVKLVRLARAACALQPDGSKVGLVSSSGFMNL